MATAMTDNSNHSSGTTTPTHLLQVPSTTTTSSSHRGLLPFPTSPSLPDRRSRLRRLNVSLATQNTTPASSSYDFSGNSDNRATWRHSISTESTSSIDDTRNSIQSLYRNQNNNNASVSNFSKRRKYRDLQDGKQMTWSKERERIFSARNGRRPERKSEDGKDQLFTKIGPPVLPPVGTYGRSSSPTPTNTSTSTVSTARSQRRNIITPRNYHLMGGGGDGQLFPARDSNQEYHRSRKELREAKRQRMLQGAKEEKEDVEEGEEAGEEVRGQRGEEKENEDDERNRLFHPKNNISLRRSSPPLHEDFFLTSLVDYEDPPARTNRRSSTTSKESGKEKEEEISRDIPPSRDNNDVTKTPSPSRDLRVTSASTENEEQQQLVLTDTEKSQLSSHDIAQIITPEENQNEVEEKDSSKHNNNNNNNNNNSSHNNRESITSTSTVTTSRIPVPVASSRELREPREPRESREPFETPRDTRGLQRVYLEGLDYMRGHVTTVEEEMERIDKEFHKIQTSSGGDRMYYLKECNERLLQANSELRKHDVSLEVIDSSTRLVRLLNEIRGLKPPANKDLVDFLTHFWDDSKSTTEQLQSLLIKFDTTVLQRLSNNYITSHSADLKVPICQQYASDIEDFLKDLGQELLDANTLIKSYDSGIHQDLYDTSGFSDQLMLMCDLNAFPLLGFVQAVCSKMTSMCQKARQWLARDEKFMHEINTFIKETRSVARRREIVLQNEKEKQKRREKNVKIAQSMLHNNREKLVMIETELKRLEDKVSGSKVEQKQKADEIHKKETMVDFLKLTLQQTKRNYTLQSKRSRLLRQVHELEDYLKTMENELETVQDMILAKSHEKILLKEKVQNSEQSYASLKTGLDKFSDNLEKLEADVTSLSGQLLHLEIVHTIRTSPETLDNLIDRPSTVKLSQSLKEKIRERKKKAALKNS